MGAFPCVYIVLAYLGAGWNRATPPQADTAMRFVREAQLPCRIQNIESRSRGAPPLPPEPAVACKPPTAAGKLFGSSSAPGIAATLHRARHWPPSACALVPLSRWQSRHVRRWWTPASLFRERTRVFPTPVVLGVEVSPSFLGAVYPRPTMHVRAGACTRTATGPPTGENKQKMGYNGACCLSWLW